MRNIDTHFRDRISGHLKRLEYLYNKGVRLKDPKSVGEMGRRMGGHVILGTPQGLRIKGSRAIGQFFQRMRKAGKYDVKFTLKRFWIFPTVSPIRKKNWRERVAHICFYIVEFRLKGNPSDQAGGLSGTAKHKTGCPIVY